jgi:hypothetical protein
MQRVGGIGIVTVVFYTSLWYSAYAGVLEHRPKHRVRGRDDLSWEDLSEAVKLVAQFRLGPRGCVPSINVGI